MKYNSYVPAETLVSEIGFGAWQLGESQAWQPISEKEAVEMVQKALEMGVNYFDTSPNYGAGTSEERLGKAQQRVDRSKYIINTKFGHTVDGKVDFNPERIRRSLEGSLRRLKIDFVDSLILHNPPVSLLDGNQNPHYDILEQLMSEGKIKAYGASLDHAHEVEQFMKTTNGKVVEVFFNILHQDVAKVFEEGKKRGIRFVAKIPLDSGWLSGKYDSNSRFKGVRKRWSRADVQKRSALVNELEKLLPEGMDMVQMAIGFCLAFDAVATVIPGNRNILQLKENVESAKFPIPKSLKKELQHFYKTEVEAQKLPW